MLGRKVGIFKLIGIVIVAAVALFFLFKASISGSIL